LIQNESKSSIKERKKQKMETELSAQFANTLPKLFKVCRRIFEIRETVDVGEEPNKNEQKALSKYIDVFEKTRMGEINSFHADLFRKIYSSKRDLILNSGHRNESWIKSNFTVIFGSNQGYEGKARIFVSEAYQKAIHLRENAEDSQNPETANYKTYPTVLMMVILDIFRIICPEDDKQKISIMIGELKSDLGVSDGNAPPNMAGGLSSLMNFATSMLSSLPKEAPGGGNPGSEAPDMSQISGKFKEIFENPDIQDTMSGLFKSLSSGGPPPDFGQVFSKVTEAIGDPNLKKSVDESLGKMEQQKQTIRQLEDAGKEEDEN
jgi:hypothetical protein